MYYYSEAEKKERRKIITIITITVILILLLIISIVVVAANKPTRQNISETENSSFSIDAETDEKEDEKKSEDNSTKETEKDGENKPSVIGNISTKTTESSESEATPNHTNSSMPNTGPEDGLMLALVAGLLTTSTTAYAMSKRKA